MKKTFSILFFILFFASCGKAGGTGSVAHEELMTAEQFQIPTDAFTFDVRAKLTGFSAAQEEKVNEAIDLIKMIVGSEDFKNKILNKTYNGKRAFVDNGGLTNAQVYQKILDGAERLGTTTKNNRMDVTLELYLDPESIAIGYTYPNVQTIWMNKKYFNVFRPYQVAGNLFHEWLHKLGFRHAMEDSPARPHSVPYYVGYLMRNMAKKLGK